jgi:hypothetical protein
VIAVRTKRRFEAGFGFSVVDARAMQHDHWRALAVLHVVDFDVTDPAFHDRKLGRTPDASIDSDTREPVPPSGVGGHPRLAAWQSVMGHGLVLARSEQINQAGSRPPARTTGPKDPVQAGRLILGSPDTDVGHAAA